MHYRERKKVMKSEEKTQEPMEILSSRLEYAYLFSLLGFLPEVNESIDLCV
jgi:hypothetical protein